MKASLSIALLLSAAFLTACGGGSGASKTSFGGNYSGKKSPAAIDESNSNGLAQASVDVTRALTVGESLPSVPLGVEVETIGKDIIREAAEHALRKSEGALENLPIAAEYSESGSCGGTARYSGNESKFTVNFYNYCDYDYDSRTNVTLNGKMTFEFSGDNTYISMSNYSVKSGSEVIVMSGNISLTESGDTEVFTMNVTATVNGVTEKISFRETCNTRTNQCSLEQELTVSDGTTYLVEDAQVTSYSFGWYVNAKFYDPSEGSVSLSAQNIVFCNDGESIESGTIILEDAEDNELTLTFSGCSDMTISLNNITANVIVQ
jgi:hypothetical protein